IQLETRLDKESLWLTQGQLALAFGVERPAITKHLDHIFKTGELNENTVSSKIELTARDGKKYQVKIYNLDAIISVGYRVNSKKATQFRIWAKEVLKKHIIDGYTINENKLIEADSKIAELRNVLNLIQEENHKLKKTSNLKSEFVALATHQIRGPLGAIKGYVSLILEGDYGKVPKEFIEPLDIIFKSTDTLTKTVSDFLDVSRIEHGQMKYFMKDFDLKDLVTEVINELSPNIKNKGLDLRISIPNNETFLVHDDKAKLKQVLMNLVDNACKYTQTGWIEIGLIKTLKSTTLCQGQSSTQEGIRSSNDKILFSVRDSGVGISKETMPLLFKKFSRAKDAGKANILGTGLGLYVAQKMIEAQNGRIWAESDGEGKGSQFYVELDLIK
ncbi:MAG: RhuM family protein, partial [bacterium]